MVKLKYWLTICLFCGLLASLAVTGFATEDGDISAAERRPLAQVPEFSLEDLLSGDYMTSWETYLLDQFPLRDQFRALNGYIRLNLLGQKDIGGVYVQDGHAFSMEYPLKENQVAYGVDKINQVIETYLVDNAVYFAIVPDKNYFAGEDYLKLDYATMESMMAGINGTYLNIFDLQTLDDYYQTDAHWKQEAIFPTAAALADGMGLGATLIPDSGFTSETLAGFEGVYWGQSPVPLEQDDLTYVTSDAILAATMTGVEFDGIVGLYAPEKFHGVDGYDVYMEGAQAIVTVESPNAKTDKELIIFRDSFGSSLAPYFAEGYSKITLVDLRYVATSYLGQFVDFADQDVLFLYSSSVLNSAMLLK
ncbi:MAG: DHHW family protein [Eubacteriales bacterium]